MMFLSLTLNAMVIFLNFEKLVDGNFEKLLDGIHNLIDGNLKTPRNH